MPENARDAESHPEPPAEQPAAEPTPATEAEPAETAAQAAAQAPAEPEVPAEPEAPAGAEAAAEPGAAAEPDAEAPQAPAEPEAAAPAEATEAAEATGDQPVETPAGVEEERSEASPAAGAPETAAVPAPEHAPQAAETGQSAEPEKPAAAPEPVTAEEPESAAAPAGADGRTEPETSAEPARPAAEAEAKPEEAEPTETKSAEPAEEAKPAEAKPADETKTEEAGLAEAKPEPPPEPVEEPEEVKALRAAQESGTALEGKVIGWNRGGFHVALEGGITAFCPNSEMELQRPRAPETYVDRSLTFRVIKVQRRGRRVVLSRQAILKQQREELLAKLVEQEASGAVLEGTVSSITDFGAFVDLGGLEGLVHVSELARRRVGHPKSAVELGQKVQVKLLKVEQGGERISLSMKALEPDPWKGVAERYPAGSEFSGKVVRKTDFGLFVELEPEVDGLVHLSRLPHGVEMDDKTLEVGETVSGWVQSVDTKRQRISLSLRELPKGDPWRGIDEKFPEGAVVEGTVESAAPFGVFVNLEPGLTGLLPMSEMSVPRGTHPARMYSPGQKVPVQVVGIDKRRKRISLAREGSKVEGSKADYQAYKKRQQEASSGLNALAAAFAKLEEDQGDDRGA